MGLSLSEIVVVLIVALLVTKPSDIPIIIRKIREWRTYFTSWQKQLNDYLEQDVLKHPIKEEDKEQLNFYIERIILLQGSYTGEYNIAAVKAFYHKLVLERKLNIKKNKLEDASPNKKTP